MPNLRKLAKGTPGQKTVVEKGDTNVQNSTTNNNTFNINVTVNGKSDDVLLYKNHEGKPFNVIVIGGDKLSRGLTLEGLTVSYFTRSSNTYDTLMQMGRWFGFRPGYLDACRLFTTPTLHFYFGSHAVEVKPPLHRLPILPVSAVNTSWIIVIFRENCSCVSMRFAEVKAGVKNCRNELLPSVADCVRMYQFAEV